MPSELYTSQLLGDEEVKCFCDGDCSVEEGESASTPMASGQWASSSLQDSSVQGFESATSSFSFTLCASSFPGGYTTLGLTHIHRLGSISGPTEYRGVGVPQPMGLRHSQQPPSHGNRANYSPSASVWGFFARGGFGGSTIRSLYLATGKSKVLRVNIWQHFTV